MGEFLMPSLGADMDKGTVLEWLVKPGDAVTKGDTIVILDTDKSDIEAEVFESGSIGELLVEEGTEVPVGTPLATIISETEQFGAAPRPSAAPTPRSPTAEVPSEARHELVPTKKPPRATPTTKRTAGVVLSPLVRHLAAERHVDTTAIVGTGPGGKVTRADIEASTARAPSALDARWVRSSPLARRLASEAGIELSALEGSGPGGAVIAADVSAAPVSKPPAPRDRKDRIRASIAEAMARSKRDIPHYYLQTTVDLGPALDWLQHHNESRSVSERILPAALLLAATATAAAGHPELNGWWEDGHQPADHVHLGVAVSLRGGGLVAPGIADADRLSLSELMAALRDLVKRARAGRLHRSEFTGQTITVTNLGDLGVDSVQGVINPPQLAMVGFGAVHDAPVAVEGEVVVRPVVVASLAADHRASDGMAGATFLAEIAAALRDPERFHQDGAS